MKHLLFNIASRSRPDKFKGIVKSIYEMCSQPFTILAKVDNDDPRKDDYFIEGVVFEYGLSENKLHAINRNIPKDGWDIIIDVSDDFIFTKPGFDQIIRDNCGHDEYLHFPEPFADKQVKNKRNESIVILYCADKVYFNRTGWIYNPAYKSLFADNEGTTVARVLGRYKYVDENIFYHAHPAAGYGKSDAQTRYTESFWDEDKKTYLERKAKNFDL